MTDGRTWRPFEVTPAAAGVSADARGLTEYLGGCSDFDELLIREKALVFRGFHVSTDTLNRVMGLILPNRLAYVHGNSPRTKVGQNLYTSTEYPPEYTISMHNEMSYAGQWPTRLLFFCDRAPASGGATPVVDGARWLAALEDEVRDAFAGGVLYTQNLHGGKGFGKSWQDTFETESASEVEKFLAGSQATWKWKPDGGLRVSQRRPATVRHPVTGVEVWFNQADQWHADGLGDETATALRQIMPDEDLPQSVTFADGSPIPGAYVRQVRDRGLDEAVDVDWQEGDLLLVDNVLAAHGRRPFTGARRVLVAMSDQA